MASTTPEKPPATADKPPQRRETGHGIVIARPFGIPVYVSPYWFLIAGVFILIYASDLASTLHGATRFIVAAAFVVLLYVSVLIHELSHSLVARGYGLPVRRILLYPLGGFSEIEQEPPTPGREFLVSAAGPALSLALAAGGYGLMHVVPADTVAGTLVHQLSWANLVVGIFNLLPGLPLDGGRMLRAVIWKLTGRPSHLDYRRRLGGPGDRRGPVRHPVRYQRGEPGPAGTWSPCVAGGDRGLHVDRRRAGHQGDQVPRAAARAAGQAAGPQGGLGRREHPAGRGDQARG